VPEECVTAATHLISKITHYAGGETVIRATGGWFNGDFDYISEDVHIYVWLTDLGGFQVLLDDLIFHLREVQHQDSVLYTVEEIEAHFV
jgi:hypothetical protein